MSEDPTQPKITDDEIKRPEFSWRPIEELIPYPNNTRDHTEEQIKILMYSLVHYGWKKFPAIEAKSNYIVAGHGIIEAARRLGLKKIPCTVSDDTDENHRGYRIMDNKSQEMSSWIDKTLNLELVELDSMGFNVGLTGFSDEELRQRIEGYGAATDEELKDLYSKRIEAPIYEPKGEKPEISELFNIEKTDQLINEIESVEIPPEIKSFLRLAAARHTVFDYEKIAEFYAHSPEAIQSLMEKSALVIIDFKKAIENGFVSMAEEISALYPPNSNDPRV